MPRLFTLLLSRLLWPLWLSLLACASLAAPGDEQVVQAREAFRKKDKTALAQAANALRDHPLAGWVAYWELNNRLNTATVDELEAFYARHAGSYVEDRLRNDWLLELGRRREWAALAKDYPRFRMNDDREVSCYHLLTQHQAGKNVRDAARALWLAQRELDDGCNLLASTLHAEGLFNATDAWAKARSAMEQGRLRSARAAASLVSPAAGAAVAEMSDNPARWLLRRTAVPVAHAAELNTLAIMRMAANDPDAAAGQLSHGVEKQLPKPLAALAWATVGKQAALRLHAQALDHYRKALDLSAQATAAQRASAPWSDDTLAWLARAALRSTAPDRWELVELATAAMTEAEGREATWVYWRARAQLARAAEGAAGEAVRQAARAQLEGLASPFSFYGKLALEDLGRPLNLPAAPGAPSATEREAARAHAGLGRALQLIALGLRNEGVREWNFSLRGMADRELLAAAQWACEREVWDRCINTSERTRSEVDMAQRFPTPLRAEVVAKAQEIGLDPAYVYGLIRQESRFITDARSHVGASGLMQLMPATARWTAKRIGLPYTPELIIQPDTNLRLGTAYLKLALDDFGGSQAMAAAAYNAGPSRPRRWREGTPTEAAAWAENIPFNETRDYVKKVLSNAVLYSHVMGQRVLALRSRLGPPIGPRDASAPPLNTDLP